MPPGEIRLELIEFYAYFATAMNLKTFSMLLALAVPLVHVSAQVSLETAGVAFQAVKDDNAAPLRNLIAQGFDIEFHYGKIFGGNMWGRTLLIHAVLEKKRNITKLLITEGAKVDAPDANGRTALMYASMGNDVEASRLLIAAPANINLQDGSGYTALHWAAAKNASDVVNLLLERRADLSLQTKRLGSVAEIAALWGNKTIFDRLISAGAPYQADLVYVSALGDLDGIKQQLANGAELDRPNKSEMTALEAAVFGKQVQAVRFLLSLDANPNAGYPLILAIRERNREIATILLQSKADPNIQDKTGMYPLIQAINVEDIGSAALLLERGAKVFGVGNKYSPIHEAAQADNPEILKLLLDHGADINSTAYRGGWTPLMLAAGTSKPRATLFLLKSSARVGVKGKVMRLNVIPGVAIPPETGNVLAQTGAVVVEGTALQLAQWNELDTIVQIFQDPDKFTFSEREPDFTNSRVVKVADWKRKYAAFDPQRGIIASVDGFKKTFGEPTRAVDAENTTFWYYQCVDGEIELRLTGLKFSGGQLFIKGMSAVANREEIVRSASTAVPATQVEVKSVSRDAERVAPPQDQAANLGGAPSTKAATLANETAVLSPAPKPNEPSPQAGKTTDYGRGRLAGALALAEASEGGKANVTDVRPQTSGAEKITMAQWFAKVAEITRMRDDNITIQKEQLFDIVGMPTSTEKDDSGFYLHLFWECVDGRIQVAAFNPVLAEGRVGGKVSQLPR